MMDDELVSAIKLLVRQEMSDTRTFHYAHVADYDPAQHAVRVVVPGLYNEFTGRPSVSGWLPISTQQVGPGIGIQVAPRGGASEASPTAGEQCLVALTDRSRGAGVVLGFFYNNSQQAPSPALSTTLQAGEMVATSNGVTCRWHANGDFEVTTTGRVLLTSTGATVVQSAGSMTVQSTGGDTHVTASGTVYLSGAGGTSKRIARDGDSVTGGVVHASGNSYST